MRAFFVGEGPDDRIKTIASGPFGNVAKSAYTDMLATAHEWFSPSRTRSTEAMCQVVPYLYLIGPVFEFNLQPHILATCRQNYDKALYA